MTNLDSVLKSRDITLPTKDCIVKIMVFLVIMYRCESWTIKKAERRKFDAFELWYWRRLSRIPWTARRSNQSILKEISPEYSLEGLMLKLQYFGCLIQRAKSLEKTLILGNIEGRREKGDNRGWDGWMASLTRWKWVWVMGDGEGQGSLVCCSPWGCRVGQDWGAEWQRQVFTLCYCSSGKSWLFLAYYTFIFNLFF